MSIKTLTCPPPVRKPVQLPELDFELLDQAIDHYAQGEHAAALNCVLRHRFPGRDIPEGASGSFQFLQGSSEISLRWDEEKLSIAVPLVTLPEGGRQVAALRYLLTKLGGWGQLLHPRIKGQEAYLEYEDQLSRSHPVKVLQTLEGAATKADMVDDWMEDQFGAGPLGEGSVTPLSAEELERAELIWRSHWNEVEELVAETERKRSMFLLNEVTAYAWFHIKQALPLAGSLGTRLSEAADIFNNADEEPDKRVAVLKKSAKEYQATPAEELAENLGHGHYSISPLAPGQPQILVHNLGPKDYMDRVDDWRKNGEMLIAAVALFTTYHYMLALWSWPEPIAAALQDGVNRASGKPWREAFDILWEQAAAVVGMIGEEEEDEEDEAGGWGDPSDEEAS